MGSEFGKTRSMKADNTNADYSNCSYSNNPSYHSI